MRADGTTLSALTARAQLGDRTALERLLRALSPGLRSHLSFLLAESSDVDDVLQDVLWIMVRRLGTLHDAPLVRAWAYRIATREARRLLRRSSRTPVDVLAEADAIAAPEAEYDIAEPEVHSAVLQYMDCLPRKAGAVVRLRFVEGLSQKEIAEALEIPLGTVKSRLAYGLIQLRTLLGAPETPVRRAERP